MWDHLFGTPQREPSGYFLACFCCSCRWRCFYFASPFNSAVWMKDELWVHCPFGVLFSLHFTKSPVVGCPVSLSNSCFHCCHRCRLWVCKDPGLALGFRGSSANRPPWKPSCLGGPQRVAESLPRKAMSSGLHSGLFGELWPLPKEADP